MNAEIFISYSSKEKAVTEYVCDKLEKAGLKCWMAHRDIPVGSDYAEQIPDVIANCKVFLLLMSDHAQKSKYVRREINEAVDRDKRIIPFYIKKTELTNSFQFLLKQSQHIEGFNNQSGNSNISGFSYGPTFASTTKDFGLREDAIEQLIKQVKTYLGYSDEDPVKNEPVALLPEQIPVIIQAETPKRYRKKKNPVVCPNCSDGNLKKAKYAPEMFASELDDRPVALSIFAGSAISIFYLLTYAMLYGKRVTTPAAETTPIVETIPIAETIVTGEKTSEIGGNILTHLGDFFETILGILLVIFRVFLPLVLLIGIVSFVIYFFLRKYKNHFTMIKNSKMRIWSFQCCSCMHKFTIITRASDNLYARVPNLVKKPRKQS